MTPDVLAVPEMYRNWGANLTVVAATIAAVVAAVLVHYEGLGLLSARLARRQRQRRRKVLVGIAGILVLHVVEIWIFGVACWLLMFWPACGHIAGYSPLHLLDAVYFSAITFSTVGFGDLAPVGPLRFLIGTESLAGFVLITWSASFTYLEMEQFWRRDGRGERS
ncbi:MAG: potassium channel family protein [Dokdonella sp.]|nr:two pore domain potassium channel family protein [Dokdonella sp.]MCB1572788.1 two pore domain potassium channel family protein [Xanthomonadales bacterium]